MSPSTFLQRVDGMRLHKCYNLILAAIMQGEIIRKFYIIIMLSIFLECPAVKHHQRNDVLSMSCQNTNHSFYFRSQSIIFLLRNLKMLCCNWLNKIYDFFYYSPSWNDCWVNKIPSRAKQTVSSTLYQTEPKR